MLRQSLPPLDALLWAMLAFVFVADAWRRAQWQASPRAQRVWALSTFAVLLGHRMAFTLPEGIELHYLGAAWLTVLVGFPRALLSMAAVLTVHMAWQDASSTTWGLRVLVDGVLPVWTMWAVVQSCRRWLPRNLFVFLFGCGVFGFALVYALELVVTALVLNATGVHRAPLVWGEFLPYALLLAWGEAWLEGMLTTLLVVYLPGSVRLFDERFYLSRVSA